MTYYFGEGHYNQMKITADTIEEAKAEFAFSCGDFAKYSRKSNYPFSSTIQAIPYGYDKNGRHTKKYDEPRFYSVVNIFTISENGERRLEGIITAYEIEVILAQPQNALLTYNRDSVSLESSCSDVVPSKGIMLLKQQGRALQREFRQKQLELIAVKNKSALQLNDYEEQRRKMEEEQKRLNEKIAIFGVYSGIGKEVVKVHSGDNSSLEQITIFQSLRYIREDIELLSEYENFDFSQIEKFDDFLSKYYKQLLPHELCIQAFKISKYPIFYESQTIFGKGYTQKEENENIFIIIRNGDNVYRLFNNYRLNGKLFHTEEELNEIAEIKGAFSSDIIDILEGKKALNFVDSYEEREREDGRGISTYLIHTPIDCVWYPDYNKEFLDKEFERCVNKIENEIQRRKDFIEKFHLEEELNVYSWRWGEPIGAVFMDYFESYHKVFKMMHYKEAFRTKNYVLNGAINNIKRIITDEVAAQDNTAVYNGCWYEYDYSSHYDTDRNATVRFNPLNGKALNVSVVNCDYEYLKYGFFEKAKEQFLQEVQEEAQKTHILNFHTVAILQNIVDNKKIFPNFNDIDFITGQGMESINRIYDASNLLPTAYDAESYAPDVLLQAIFNDSFDEMLIGKKVYCLFHEEKEKRYDQATGKYLGSHSHRYDARKREKPFVSIEAIVERCSKQTAKVRGFFSEHSRNKYDSRGFILVWAGDKKEVSKSVRRAQNNLRSDMTVVDANVIQKYKQKILKLMNSRLFREEHYLSFGIYFKYLLKLLYEANTLDEKE